MTDFTVATTLSSLTCARCAMTFAIPKTFMEKRRNDHGPFYCPEGHNNYYPQESDEEKLRRERDRATQQLARAEDELREARRRADAAIAKTRRVTKRAHAGVCQCCNRSFANVVRHMKSKHPNVVPIKKAEARA